MECAMSFMQPQVVFGRWLAVETRDGTEFIPADVVGPLPIELGATLDYESERWGELCEALRPCCVAEPEGVRLFEGYGARLSAPGFLDCTPWVVFETEKEARDFLAEEEC